MNILALEASTVHCSAALIQDGSLLAEAEWEDTTQDHQHLFSALPDLLEKAGMRPADIECFAVDSGPGRFTGLRTAMAAAKGMALPDRRPVIGIDSGAVIAWQVWRGGSAGQVAVAGDARRNRLWMARFTDGTKGPNVLTPYTSVPIQDAAGILRSGDLLVSPDSLSLSEVLREVAMTAGAVVVSEAGRPTACTVGLLAAMRLAAGELAAPAIVYLHPPV